MSDRTAKPLDDRFSEGVDVLVVVVVVEEEEEEALVLKGLKVKTRDKGRLELGRAWTAVT
jgi:hypothetical protein